MTVYSKLNDDEKAYLRHLKSYLNQLNRYRGGLFGGDPLELIVQNKDFVLHLRGNGIDGWIVKKMLNNWHGLNLEITLKEIKRYIAECHKVDDTIRNISKLINDKVIKEEEKELLRTIKTRLRQTYYMPGEQRNKAGIPVMQIPLGKGNAKTYKQMLGFRVVEMYDYINNFITNKDRFLQNDIYDLIAELFEVDIKKKFTREEIKNFHTNNFKFLDTLKSEREDDPDPWIVYLRELDEKCEKIKQELFK